MQAELAVERFIVTIETEEGDAKRSVVLMESQLKAIAENWSKQLTVEAMAEMQLSYYNEEAQMWQPVIEQNRDELNGVWNKWQLNMKVVVGGEGRGSECCV